MRAFDLNRIPTRWQYFSVLALALGLYASTLSFDFTLDDAIVIHDNAFTKKGIEGIPDIFAHDSFRGFFKVEGKDQLVSGGRYRPLTLAIFAVLWELVGRTPWVFHLLNVIIYALTCISILFIGRNLFKHDATAILTVFLSTVLFTVHPVHVEVVANVKGMDEVLSFALGIWSFYYLTRHKWVLSAILLFSALLSKEMAITWIPIAVAFLWLFQKHKLLSSILKAWPMILGAFGYILLRLVILGWPSTEPVTEMMNNPFMKLEGSRYVTFTVAERSATIFHTLWEYLRLLLVPHPLTHDYYPRQIGVMNWSMMTPWAGLLMTAGMVVLVFLSKRISRHVTAWGLCIYLFGLILISNVIFPIGTHMGERFIFLSSWGFALVFAQLMTKWLKSYNSTLPFLALYIGLLAFFTVQRIPAWKDDHTLFTTDVETSSKSAKALNAAGGAIVNECILQTDRCRSGDIERAIDYLESALRVHPNYKNAHLLKGNAHFLKEEYREAISHFERALDLDPTYQDARENLVMAYNQAAQKSGEKDNNVDNAIILLNKAIKIDPENVETLRLLGVAHGVKGETSRAIQFFSRILEIDPDNAEANRNIGISYMHLGQEEKAKTYLRKANSSEQENQ